MRLRGTRWRIAGALVGAWAALGLLGCASPLALQAPRGYLDFGYSGGEGREIRVIRPFEDLRVRPKCDPKKANETHTYLSPHLQLGCSEEPPDWFAERLATALHGAGFTVIEEDRAGTSEVIEVRGKLRSLEVEQVMLMQSGLFESDVSIVLDVSTPSGLRASRGFYVKSSRNKAAGGQGTLQTLLDESAMRVVRDMTAAILSLTNRYPTLGRAAAEPAASNPAEVPKEAP